jgi:hypothetical protein
LIILDTCVLRGCGLESSGAELLRTIRESGTEGVAIPWVVMEDLVAQHAGKYSTRFDAVVQAVQGLENVSPWPVQPLIGDYDPEAVRQY